MSFEDQSGFWWRSITGAHRIVVQVVDALVENAAVLLDIPADLPWRQEMRSVIEEGYRSRSGSADVIIEVIDAADECPAQQSPGSFLLQRFAPNRETRTGYRERSSRTIQEYLKEKAVLKNRIVWIKGLSGRDAAAWLEFCKGYSRQSPEYGMFVLEVHGGGRFDENTFRHVRYLDHVTGYDLQLFNSFLLEDLPGLSAEWKQYISAVAASLCDTDAEVSAALVQALAEKGACPLQKLAELAGAPAFAARGAEPGSGHVLALGRRKETAELEKRLWKAQVQSLFPLIEMERVQLIGRHEQAIRAVLDANYIERFHEEVKEPIEAELSTLCKMMDVYRLQLPEKKRIRLLRDCRNCLAHIKCCSPDRVQALLDGR